MEWGPDNSVIMFAIIGVAFVCSAIAVYLLRPLCVRLRHVDQPGGRKTHAVATPLCGGLAIASTIVVLGIWLLPSWQVSGFAFGVLVLLLLGAVDDRRHVPAFVRLALQALAVGVGMCLMGGITLQNLGALTGSGDITLEGLATAFTIFAAVGVINAINMIDGVDGLAGSFAVMIVSVFLVFASDATVVNIVLLCLTMGSVLGFLLFNLRMPWQRQARIFLGDAGSLVLGYILTWFAIQSSQGQGALIDPITAVWLLGLPLVDTAYLMLSRLLEGRSPLSADRRHFHHLLQRAGLTPGWTLYAWLSVAACFAAFGIVGEVMHVPEAYRYWVFLMAAVAFCSVLKICWRRLEREERRSIARVSGNLGAR